MIFTLHKTVRVGREGVRVDKGGGEDGGWQEEVVVVRMGRGMGRCCGW